MKSLKVFAFLAVMALLTITSCKDEDNSCKTCTLSTQGVTAVTKYCQEGDNVIQTTNGVSVTLPNTTVSVAVTAQTAAGATCE